MEWKNCENGIFLELRSLLSPRFCFFFVPPWKFCTIFRLQGIDLFQKGTFCLSLRSHRGHQDHYFVPPFVQTASFLHSLQILCCFVPRELFCAELQADKWQKHLLILNPNCCPGWLFIRLRDPQDWRWSQKPDSLKHAEKRAWILIEADGTELS